MERSDHEVLFSTILDYLLEATPYSSRDYVVLEDITHDYAVAETSSELAEIERFVRRNTPGAKIATATAKARQLLRDVRDGRYACGDR